MLLDKQQFYKRLNLNLIDEYRPTNAVQESQKYKIDQLNKNSHVLADNENRKLQIKI